MRNFFLPLHWATVHRKKKRIPYTDWDWNCTIFTIHNKSLEKHMSFICRCICTYQSCKQIRTISLVKYSFHLVEMFQALGWFVLYFSVFFFRCCWFWCVLFFGWPVFPHSLIQPRVLCLCSDLFSFCDTLQIVCKCIRFDRINGEFNE